VVAVSVTDPREKELPEIGLLTVEDAETGEQIELNTGRMELRQMFAEYAEQGQRQLRRTIRSSGAELIELSTDKPYLPALMTFFSNRKGRR
jgi:uncharacterized protein (DUF58 family)